VSEKRLMTYDREQRIEVGRIEKGMHKELAPRTNILRLSSRPFAPSSMPIALCSLLSALCAMLFAIYAMRYALCAMPCAIYITKRINDATVCKKI